MDAVVWSEISTMDKKELREALQEAVDLWLDKKFSQFGKWSVGAIAASALGALLYFIVTFGEFPRK